MSVLIFTEVQRREEKFDFYDGVLLNFRPFRRNSLNEVDARKIRDALPKGSLCWGIFDAPGLCQLLYLLSEDLINGALVSRLSERELHRLRESYAKPIFTEGTCKTAEAIQREQRLPMAGHFFWNIPEEDVLSVLEKPYILSMQAIDGTEANATLLRRYPPFALWCGSSAEAKKAKAGNDIF